MNKQITRSDEFLSRMIMSFCLHNLESVHSNQQRSEKLSADGPGSTRSYLKPGFACGIEVGLNPSLF